MIIPILTKLFWLLCKSTLVSIYACSGTRLKIDAHILRLSNQQANHKVAINKQIQSYKRPRRDPPLSVSDEDEYLQPKKTKIANACLPLPLPSKVEEPIQEIASTGHRYTHQSVCIKKRQKRLNNATKNNTSLDHIQSNLTKEVLARLPNTLFFKSLKCTITHEQNSPLAQEIIKKLDGLHQLKIPYSFLSSILRRCNDLEPCDTLLSKVLIKSDNGGYTTETKLQKILNNDIKLSNLSSMLHGCGNNAATAFEALINTLTQKEIVEKIKILKNLGFATSNLSSMLGGCRNKAYASFEALINRLTQKEMVEKLIKVKKLGFTANNLSSMLNQCGNKSPEVFEALINKLTQKEMVDKVTNLKKLGLSPSNLSSMLSGCGNKSPEVFEGFVNKLTQKEMMEKLKTLKNLGFATNNLSSMLNRCRNEATTAFQVLINKMTEKEMLDKVTNLKNLGCTASNLSSMLNGCGNQAAATFETLSNRLTEQAMVEKLKTLKNLGFAASNLSSMLSRCGNQAATTFETLVNKITQKEMVKKLEKLKKLGFTVSNLSSMLSRCGNEIATAFEALVNKINGDKLFPKLKALKDTGILPSYLSGMLTGSGVQAADALDSIVDLISNQKYIDTVKKVTAALYSTTDVLDKDNEILVSRKASKQLSNINNLKSIQTVSDPSNHPTFKKFLIECYNKNSHVDDRLMEIKKVSDNDPRIDLRGQDKVVAKKKINKGSILGIYTGILLCDEDPTDNAVELAYLATKNIYGLNKLDSYSFSIDLGTSSALYLSACGRGNMLMKINANQTYDLKSTQAYKANVTASWNSCDERTPFILFHATQDIAPNEELLFDYGKYYWDHHGSNNDLSNPDAKIYKDLLTTKKYVDQAASTRLLRLIKDYDLELYQTLLQYIYTPPCNDLAGKDRLVECRKINNPKIAYRIYKLPGESSIGEPSKNYFSVNWDPTLGLDALDKYNWSDTHSGPLSISLPCLATLLLENTQQH